MVAALAFVLAFVATASADDTRWVLWVRKDYDAGLAGEWRIVASFKTRPDCTQAMRWRLAEVSTFAVDPRAGERGSVLIVVGGAATALQCVPDITPLGKTKEGTR